MEDARCRLRVLDAVRGIVPGRGSGSFAIVGFTWFDSALIAGATASVIDAVADQFDSQRIVDRPSQDRPRAQAAASAAWVNTFADRAAVEWYSVDAEAACAAIRRAVRLTTPDAL